jgi:hypothetical protein
MTKIAKRIKFTEENKNPREVWPRANRFYYTEMMPLLYYIDATGISLVQLFNNTFKKYLITSCVGLIDYYITLKISKYIEEENIDIDAFGLKRKYEKMLIDYPDMTRGECVVVQNDFTNSHNINKIATLVLRQDKEFNNINMGFFDAVKKIDWYDPYKYVKGFDNAEIVEAVKPLTENWDNFVYMFELRHKIIHEMNEDFILIGKLASMCDSTMNFIDAADFILNIDHRKDVLKRLESKITLRELNARIDKAMDAAIAKGNIPAEYDIEAYYKHRGFDQNGKPVI